jgi:serine/threonine protein kinase
MSDTDKTRVSKQTRGEGADEGEDATLIGFDSELTETMASNTEAVDATELDNDKTVAVDDLTQVSDSDDLTEVASGLVDDADFFISDDCPVANTTSFDVGSVLKARFHLEKKLGEGGMGAVFLAVDQRKLEAKHKDPYVAIKLITGDFSQDPMAYISLQRETDKSQKLAHPNIITVYDFDRDGDVFFMTMEALKGRTLDQIIKDRTHCQQHAGEYITAIAQGIAYAHKRNILHSDLKPANIFVTDEGVVKVLDFGIARALYSSGDDIGEVVGLTPGYASCEMIAAAPPHTSDDVYAIGIIAYQLYTGEHPFAKKKATVARDEGLRAKRIKGIPNYQWRAINGALAFNRDERCYDADQFFRQFTGAGRRIRQLSLALFVLLLGFASYVTFYEPELGPEIPFEELPIAVQQQFSAHLAEADLALRFNDVNGALFYLDRAYVLHPRNPDVMDKLDDLVANMTAAIHATQAEPAQRVQQVDELLKYESLEQNPALLNLKKALISKPQSP